MDLGKYVIARFRPSTGIHSVALEVPKRLRPEGWPPTIPLPQFGRTGNLNDPDELSRIKADAAALLEELTKQRAGNDRPLNARTWRALMALYERSSKFTKLKDVTKKNYAIYMRRLLAYFDLHPELQPATIKESEVEGALLAWQSPDTTYNEFVVLRLLLKKAMREKWRTDDPTAEIECKPPEKKERRTVIWEAEDIAVMQGASSAAGFSSIAKLIQTEWEIGQRLTDARHFRYGVEYVDGMFRFHQSKTDSYVTVPISASLQALLACDAHDGGYLFVNPRTGYPFEEQDLGMIFGRIRDKVPGYENRPITLRHLRHSCVVQMARAGCTIPEIASITGHSMVSVHRIIEHYLPRDNVLAQNAVQKRLKMNQQALDSLAA